MSCVIQGSNTDRARAGRPGRNQRAGSTGPPWTTLSRGGKAGLIHRTMALIGKALDRGDNRADETRMTPDAHRAENQRVSCT